MSTETMGLSAEGRLASLSIELPTVSKPIANFAPWRRIGDLVYLIGQVREWNGVVICEGKLDADVELEAGKKAARVCGLNLIAAIRQARRRSRPRPGMPSNRRIRELRAGLPVRPASHRRGIGPDARDLRLRDRRSCPDGHRRHAIAAWREGRGRRDLRCRTSAEKRSVALGVNLPATVAHPPRVAATRWSTPSPLNGFRGPETRMDACFWVSGHRTLPLLLPSKNERFCWRGRWTQFDGRLLQRIHCQR